MAFELQAMGRRSASFRLEEQEALMQSLSEIQRLEQNRHLEDPDPDSRLRHLGLTVTNIHALADKRPDLQIKPDKMLGKGGFGTVYKGSMNLADGKRKVAIKVCQIGRRGEGTPLSLLCHEARVWDHLKGCDFLCQLLDRVVVGRSVWFIVELADAGDILSLIRQQERHRLELNVARYLFKQVVTGINFMHGRGIAHRDIKVENILLFSSRDSPFGLMAKVSDFGLTTIAWTPRTGIVRKNNQCGTRPYMAPEILFLTYMKIWNELPDDQSIYTDQISWTRDPGHASHASNEIPGISFPKIIAHRDYQDKDFTNALSCDYYALGVTLFVMLTGKYPRYKVPRKDFSVGLDYVMAGKVIKFSFMPESCREFLRSMLEPNPVKRATIKCILNHDWMRDNPPTRSQRKRPEDLKLPVGQIRRPSVTYQGTTSTSRRPQDAAAGGLTQTKDSLETRRMERLRKKQSSKVPVQSQSPSASTPRTDSHSRPVQEPETHSSPPSLSVRFASPGSGSQGQASPAPSLSLSSSSPQSGHQVSTRSRPSGTRRHLCPTIKSFDPQS